MVLFWFLNLSNLYSILADFTRGRKGSEGLPLDYKNVVEEVEATNSTHTWFGWNNLCDVAFVGISRGDSSVSVKAVYKLEQLLEVVEKTVGNKHWEVKRRLGEVSNLLLKGDDVLVLYWLGQLRSIIADVQKSVKDIGQPYRQQLCDGVQAIIGPNPPAEAVA